MMEERYSRQSQLPEYADFKDKVRDLQIGIVGVGGLGGLCAYLLAGAGVRHLTLADSDEVSLSNLHRQVLYRQKDVGKSKARCARDALNALDAELEVSCFDRVNAANFKDFATGCSLILDLADNLETRLLVSKSCLELKLDYVHASIAAEQGMLALFRFSDPMFIKAHGCYACLCGEEAVAASRGITGPYAATLSSLTANLAMQHLAGCYGEYGTLYLFDFKKFTQKKFKLQRSEHCRVCQNKLEA
ncbi:MAG: ThiF family adenylyltransferase [Succinivibrio sp.]|nr:ThiF family adenylyltransferase [Succinivibrio sp.]